MLFPVVAAVAGGSNTTTATEETAAKKALGELLVGNLMTAISSASSYNSNDNDGSSPAAKRQKVESSSSSSTNDGSGDKFQVLDPSFAQSNNTTSNSINKNTTTTNNNTSELSPGAILSRITLGGLVNGMAGVEGGCVDTLSCIPLSDLQNNNDQVMMNDGEKTAAKGIDAVVETAGNLLLKDLIKLARGLLRSISAR